MTDVTSLALTALVAATVSSTVLLVYFSWYRRDQRQRDNRNVQKTIVQAMAHAGRDADNPFVTTGDPACYGELVAQFKVNQGKQVVSVLEADGKRFIHIDGELSALGRAKMVRYLKSEGFMN